MTAASFHDTASVEPTANGLYLRDTLAATERLARRQAAEIDRLSAENAALRTADRPILVAWLRGLLEDDPASIIAAANWLHDHEDRA